MKCKNIKRLVQWNYMNKNKVLLFITILFMSMNFTSAVGDIGTVKQFDCIDLYNECPTCSWINLTAIRYPNVTTTTMNTEMTKSGNNFIYKFCNTGALGDYAYTTCGDKAGQETCELITFTSTPSGEGGALGFYFLILILSLGIMILGFYLRDPIIVILSSFGLYFVGLYILFFGVDGFKDPVYTWAIGIIILMIAAYISIRSSYELIVD